MATPIPSNMQLTIVLYWTPRPRSISISSIADATPVSTNVQVFDELSTSFQRHPTNKIVNRLGPWALRTRMRSMSPVRLGPVMKERVPG